MSHCVAFLPAWVLCAALQLSALQGMGLLKLGISVKTAAEPQEKSSGFAETLGSGDGTWLSLVGPAESSVAILTAGLGLVCIACCLPDLICKWRISDLGGRLGFELFVLKRWLCFL